VKNCGISIGDTFCPIEPKIGMLPILVIQNHKKYQTNKKKVQNFDFYQWPNPVVSSIDLSS
jgi:hypothetical protein